MATRWETRETQLKRFMKIPIAKKMQWIVQMQQFLDRYSSPKVKQIRQQLRAGV